MFFLARNCLFVWVRWTRVNKTYTIYDTRLKISGLLEGSEYQFRVTAVNAAGYSQPSDASPYILCKDPTCKELIFVSAKPHFIVISDLWGKFSKRIAQDTTSTFIFLICCSDTPAPPSMPRITDTTKHSISMTWTRPMYDGGSDVTGYVVEILEEGSEQWYRATTKALKTNQYVAAGLAANKKYQFRVAAINSNGTGEFSEPSVEIEPLERVGKSVLLFVVEHTKS